MLFYSKIVPYHRRHNHHGTLNSHVIQALAFLSPKKGRRLTVAVWFAFANCVKNGHVTCARRSLSKPSLVRMHRSCTNMFDLRTVINYGVVLHNSLGENLTRDSDSW